MFLNRINETEYVTMNQHNNQTAYNYSDKSMTEPVAVCLEAGAANSIINLSISLLTFISRADIATGDSNRI